MLPGLMKVVRRLGPVAAEAIMMDQLVEVILEAVSVKFLKSLSGPAVDRFAPLLEYRFISHVVDQCVLESVFGLGDGRALVNELGGLQGGKPSNQFVFRLSECMSRDWQREVFSDDRECLQQASFRWRQQIDARGDDP